jgi:hypothetical protein
LVYKRFPKKKKCATDSIAKVFKYKKSGSDQHNYLIQRVSHIAHNISSLSVLNLTAETKAGKGTSDERSDDGKTTNEVAEGTGGGGCAGRGSGTRRGSDGAALGGCVDKRVSRSRSSHRSLRHYGGLGNHGGLGDHGNLRDNGDRGSGLRVHGSLEILERVGGRRLHGVRSLDLDGVGRHSLGRVGRLSHSRVSRFSLRRVSRRNVARLSVDSRDGWNGWDQRLRGSLGLRGHGLRRNISHGLGCRLGRLRHLRLIHVRLRDLGGLLHRVGRARGGRVLGGHLGRLGLLVSLHGTRDSTEVAKSIVVIVVFVSDGR